METTSEFCSVEVTLEDGDPDTVTTGNDVDLNYAINNLLEAAQGGPEQQAAPEAVGGDRPVKRKRSLIWRHFERLDNSAAAQCRICVKKLQCSEGGSTSNLRRHISTRHPKEFSKLVSDEQNASPSCQSQGSDVKDASTEPGTEKRPLTEVELKDRDSNEKVSDARPVRRRQSSVWRYFEHLDSLAAARCRICSKKLQFFEGGSTSNLHRHMSKRHPELVSHPVAKRHKTTQSHSSQGSNVNGDTPTAPETVGLKGALETSRSPEEVKRLFRREQELIESLRRAQREEALALDHQRELLEKLRVVNAREAAAERGQIESLRTAQQEEAEDLSRQREELQKEKAELQKQWEELRQEREDLLSFSKGQQTS